MVLVVVHLLMKPSQLYIACVQLQRLHIIRSARLPVRLGAELDEQGCLTPQAIQAGAEALSQFSSM